MSAPRGLRGVAACASGEHPSQAGAGYAFRGAGVAKVAKSSMGRGFE